MEKKQFLMQMHFPVEWLTFDLYPDELFIGQIESYQADNDGEFSEHYRNGAFHWWLKRNPTKEVLMKLIHLTFLDLEQLMADDVRSYIIKSDSFDNELIEEMKNLYMARLYLVAARREG